MSKTTPDGGPAAVRPSGASPGAPEAEAAILAELAQDYQTHCAPCFLGQPEHCTESRAPNGQPCVTTPAQRIAWLLDVVQQVVAQRNTAAVEHAALTARLAEAEADAEEARTVTRQADAAARAMEARLAAALAAALAERDRLRRELAEMDDVAGNVAIERDRAEAALAAQDGRWRALVGALLAEWELLARLYSDGDVLAIDGRAWDVIAQAQAALADPPSPAR